MKNVYEIETWKLDNTDLNKIAIEAAKKHNGKKFTVTFGEWGTKTYLVFADSKEEAKEIAKQVYTNDALSAPNKTRCLEVTNSKKYN